MHYLNKIFHRVVLLGYSFSIHKYKKEGVQIVDFRIKRYYSSDSLNIYERIHARTYLVYFFDIFTGTLKSFKQKETSSSVSLFGIAKHSLVVLLIFVLNVYLPLFGFQVYAQGFTLWMVVTYLISIAENWGALGLPLPDAVEKTLIKLKEHTEDKIHIDEDVMKVEEKEKVITKEEER